MKLIQVIVCRSCAECSLNSIITEKRRTRNSFFNEDHETPRPRTHRKSPIYMSPARKRVVRNPR